MRSSHAVFVLVAAATLASCDHEPTALTSPDLPTPEYARIAGGHSVNGGGGYFSEISQVRVTFSLHAFEGRDGVEGTFHLRGHRDQGGGAIVGGELVCLTVDGNRAWTAGYILRWRRGATEYTPMGFMVVDNGEGASSEPDEIRLWWGLQGGDPPFTSVEDFCARQPVDFTFPLDAGNLQVH